MQVFQDLLVESLRAFAHQKGMTSFHVDETAFRIDPPRDIRHADLTTNAALIYGKKMGCSPQELGAFLVEQLKTHPDVAAAQLAGPGFVNLHLHQAYWYDTLKTLLQTGEAYGASDLGKGEIFNVEYVSANPTGPLHAGHGRVAVVADVLANLLEKVGYHVVREYYINDAGNQADILSRSLYLRYQEALGLSIPDIPEGYYPGEYLKDIAAALVARDGDGWLNQPEEIWLAPLRRFAVDTLMRQIRDDLETIGIRQDVFSSEQDLHISGALEATVARLDKEGWVEEGPLPPPQGKETQDWQPVPLPLFRSTAFGDDRDRPLKKADGTWTYFAGDVAYHLDKIGRGAKHLVNVWGADHGSHVKRITAAVEALTKGSVHLKILLCQTVNFFNQGQPVKMSKRSGTFITLRDVESQIGKDVLRFMMVTRKPDTHFDFDFAKAVEHSKDNPVFYVQYAHARCCSVMRMARDLFPNWVLTSQELSTQPFDQLTEQAELDLIKRLADWPRQVEGAALSLEPHRLASYLYELASAFHILWSKGNQDTVLRFLVPENESLSKARLALVFAVSLVIRSGLNVFGVKPVEEMRA